MSFNSIITVSILFLFNSVGFGHEANSQVESGKTVPDNSTVLQTANAGVVNETEVDPIQFAKCNLIVGGKAVEDTENPAESTFVTVSDDGPFSWLWAESTTTRSIYEDQAMRVKPTSNTTWLDLFPSRKPAPKSPPVQLENLSPFPPKKKQSDDRSMWQATKERWSQWNQRMKETTHRSWSNLKEKLSGE